jgi:hypothetical protein
MSYNPDNSYDNITCRWNISSQDKEACDSFFLKRWPKEQFIAHISKNDPTVLVVFGKHWHIAYDCAVPELIKNPYYGLSFRSIEGIGYVVVKSWKEPNHGA